MPEIGEVVPNALPNLRAGRYMPTEDEIAQFARSEMAPVEFYGEFLPRIVDAMAAVGGVVWTLEEQGRLALQYQVKLQDSRLAEHKLPFVLWGVWGMALLPLLWPGVEARLRIPVVLYTVAIVAMAAQAASRAASATVTMTCA